jgi:tRNA A37 threonylcarbamoyladenosine biosynthesis protein TsaE
LIVCLVGACWLLLVITLNNANTVFCWLQVPNARGTHLVRCVVEHTAKLLVEMQQMPFRNLVGVPDTVVGLDAKKERLVQLLADDSSRRMVLLHGMAGIGKTTLAKIVFNELHKTYPTVPCCFLTLDEELEGGGIVQAQLRLLLKLAHLDKAELRVAEEGCMLLAEKLQGRKVLLVVDNVWGSQLDLLLPNGLVKEVLGEGSMVLVTSRESTAADSFGPQAVVKEMEMECLSDQEALELFCKYAYHGSTSPPPSDAAAVKQVVARCGGLPMAVEVVGRHLGALRTNKHVALNSISKALPHAFGKVKAGAHKTLFAALELSWSALDEGEQEALLDIVWFLRGREWELVETYCESDYGALDRLCELGLVKQHCKANTSGNVGGVVAAVHDTVVEFCKAHVQLQRGQRVKLRMEGAPLASCLAKVGHAWQAWYELWYPVSVGMAHPLCPGARWQLRAQPLFTQP